MQDEQTKDFFLERFIKISYLSENFLEEVEKYGRAKRKYNQVPG